MTTTIVRRARPGGTRRMALDGDRSWSLRSLCRNDLQFSDGPFGTKADPSAFARQLAHNCRAHCPVIADCAAEVVAQKRPRKAVRAGVYFPDAGRPKVLPDTGCGQHCAELRGVPRKAVER